jgi:hypothetical protein
MVACLAEGAGPEPRCTPVCRNCGADLVPDENPHVRHDTARTFWQRACGCIIDVPRPAYDFTDDEVARFSALLVSRGARADVAAVLGRPLLDGLAEHLTKTVLGLPDSDVTITAEEARQAIGRDLRAQSAS